MVRSQAPAVSATSARRTASWPRCNGVVSRGQGRRGGTAGVVEAIIALLARLLGGARDQRTAVDRAWRGARPALRPAILELPDEGRAPGVFEAHVRIRQLEHGGPPHAGRP